MKLKIFTDPIGRLLVGEEITDRCTETLLVIKNPMIIHSNTVNGNLSVQFIPIVWREILADKNSSNTITYNKAMLGIFDDNTIDLRVEGQYNQIFAPIKEGFGFNMAAPQGTPQPPPPPQGGKVINLFDEK